MYRRTISQVLLSFCLVMAIMAFYFDGLIFGEKVHVSCVNNSQTVECLMQESYSELKFDTVEEFINSLGYLVSTVGEQSFRKAYNYSICEDIILDVFSNENGSILVTALPDGCVESCKFINPEYETVCRVEELMSEKFNKSSFVFKDINGGFVLEQSLI